MANREELEFMEELCRKYPFDENQLIEIEAIADQGQDHMPVVCVNGVARNYDNGREFAKLFEEEEDKDYLEWNKNKGWKIMNDMLAIAARDGKIAVMSRNAYYAKRATAALKLVRKMNQKYFNLSYAYFSKDGKLIYAAIN